MRRYFDIFRQGRYGLDIILESKVTGEVFLLLLEKPCKNIRFRDELRGIFRHIMAVRRMVREKYIIIAGDQVVFNRVYY